MMDGIQGDAAGGVAARNDEYLSKAEEVIHLKLVDDEDAAMEEDGTFSPDFTHQVVGQSEMIYGYKDLDIKVYHSSSTLLPFFSVSFSDKLDAEADDVHQMFRQWLPEECTGDRVALAAECKRAGTFQPPGTMVALKFSKGHAYEVFMSDPSMPGVREYHHRLELFAIWCIEAGQYIDLEDERWRIFTLFEKDESGMQPVYRVRGFLTVYMYYAYPEHLRPRISQMVVLPHFQRKGLGSILLQAAYEQIRAIPEVLDISVEDPSDNFMRLRDYVDCKTCITSGIDVGRGTFAEVSQRIKAKFKLTKTQIRRVYEILRLRTVNRTSCEQTKAYRLMVKKRMFQPHIKQKRTEKRQLATMAPEEIDIYQAQQQEFKAQLQTQFAVLEEYYLEVLSKLEHL